MLWGARWTVLDWAIRPVDIPSCPALPRRAPTCRVPPRLWYVRVFPGNTMHETSTKTNKPRHTGQQPGTKIGRRPADRQVVDRPMCSPIGLKFDFVCPCFGRVVQDRFLRCSGGHEGRLSPRRSDPSTSRPAPHRPTLPPHRVPPCPDPPVVCPGFGFDKWNRQVRYF